MGQNTSSFPIPSLLLAYVEENVIITNPDREYFRENEPANLTCTSSNLTIGDEFIWIKNGVNISVNTSSINIPTDRSANGTNYTCMTNTSGVSESYTVLIVGKSDI